MIKVLICANSTIELARLEALVTSTRSLRLVGSSLGRAGLSQHVADTQPDVLLEHSPIVDPEELRWSDLDPRTVARVLLVAEPQFSVALATIQIVGSAVHGVLPTWACEKEIQMAVEAAAGGLLVLHPDIVERAATTSGVLFHTSSTSFGQQLSPRENEILNLLAGGLGNKEIAWRLKISEHTVKFHITSIFNKLNASNRAEAVAVGVRRGLIIL